MLALIACSTGRDAVARGGEFQFVSPGGQTKIFYDPPRTRGTIPALAGEDLLEPGKQITRDSGVQFLGIDVRDEVRSAPQDFVRNLGITYPSIYDPPGRSLLALKGYPRSVVPSTIVLDRQHRVAAVLLTALRDTDRPGHDQPRPTGTQPQAQLGGTGEAR